MFTWTLDAPTGVFKQHELSSKIRYASIAQCKFMQFVSAEPGYGKQKGESITIQRIANVTEPTDGRLAEAQRIPEDDFTITTIAITVSEWGRAIPFTSFAQDLSKLNLENGVQRKLRDQMKLVMDKAAATAFKAGQIKAVALTSTSIQFDTGGAATAPAVSNLKLFHVEAIRDYLYNTLLAEPYDGEDYVCLLNTKAKRGLMNDANWVDWVKYTTPEKKYMGEIGKVENVRFVEVNNNNALSNAIGTGGVCGEAVFFGSDAVAMAVALDPELRAQSADFGRANSVAWYGILEFGQIWGDSANSGEAKVVHLSST